MAEMPFIWLLLILITGCIGVRLTQVCTMYGEDSQEEEEEVMVKPDLVIKVISSGIDKDECLEPRNAEQDKHNYREENGRF